MNPRIFNLSVDVSYRRLMATLRGVWKVRSQAEILEVSTYMDTFDWRLFHSGTLLEIIHGRRGWRLEWRDLGATDPRDRCRLVAAPRFAADISNPAVRNRLAVVIGCRALLPRITLRCRRRRFLLRDEEGKALLTIVLEKDEDLFCENADCVGVSSIRINPRIRLLAMKGYEGVAEAVRNRLFAAGLLSPIQGEPLLEYLSACGLKPEAQRQIPVATPADARTDSVINKLQMQHLERMRENENGVKEDIDPEFLHEFRVAVRKTRTFLGQSKGVFPHKRLSRFKRGFSWLGKISGRTRDMDVHLQALEQYRRILPAALHDVLEPMQAYLVHRRQKEYRKMRKLLDSNRYRELCRDWHSFLAHPVTADTTLTRGRQAILDAAGHLIWRMYRKACKQGRSIDADTDSAGLHRLRKTVKKLRYLMESFSYLFPLRQMRLLVRNLKVLQDNLGLIQDYRVQKDVLAEIGNALDAQVGVSGTTSAALGMIVTNLEQGDFSARQMFKRKFNQFDTPRVRQRYREITLREQLLEKDPV